MLQRRGLIDQRLEQISQKWLVHALSSLLDESHPSYSAIDKDLKMF